MIITQANPVYDRTNQKALGTFKDELNGNIASFIGPKPKSYCYEVYSEEKNTRKSKGSIKHQVKLVNTKSTKKLSTEN